MNSLEFNKLSNELETLAKEIMNKKGPEYTEGDEDVLSNFKNTSERLNTSALKIWGTFFDKQVSSVFAHVNNANLNKAESIESRFADIINYCHLGYALFKAENRLD